MNASAILERIIILEERLLKDKTLSENNKQEIIEEISELEKLNK
jgi:hypothetical protein